MDKLNALAMFVATAETGSFSRGAERLGKTPSALTKAVAHLEAELGARLFERTTRSLALTEAGQIYLEAARQSLETLRTAGRRSNCWSRSCAANCASPRRRRSPRRSSSRPAPASSRRIRGSACGWTSTKPSSISAKAATTSACATAPSTCRGWWRGRWRRTRSCFCASPAYLARQPAPQGPEDFERHAWLVFQHPSLNQNFWWMERDGARQRIDQPRPRLASDNYDFLLAHLLAGLGLQFCPQWSVAPLLGEGRLVRLLGDYHFDPGPFGPSIHVLYPGHRRNTRKVRAFLEHLRASLQRQGLCHRL